MQDSWSTTLIVTISAALVSHLSHSRYHPSMLNDQATHVWLKTCDPVPLWAAVTAILTVPLLITQGVGFLSPSSATSLSLVYPCFLLALAASVSLYRLSPFHPLAKYPGPFILRISKLWSAWVAHQGKTHVYIKELHDRYGPIVRIGGFVLTALQSSLMHGPFTRA